jgi:hypothetical protein
MKHRLLQKTVLWAVNFGIDAACLENLSQKLRRARIRRDDGYLAIWTMRVSRITIRVASHISQYA